MTSDQQNEREKIKERFIEIWGVDMNSQVEMAQADQETDLVLVDILKGTRQS